MMNQDHLVFLVGNLGRVVGRNGQLQFWQLNWSTGPKKEHLKKVLKPTGQDPSAKSMKLQVNTVCLVYLSIVVVWWSNIVSSIALYLQTIMSLTTSWTSWTSKTHVACFGTDGFLLADSQAAKKMKEFGVQSATAMPAMECAQMLGWPTCAVDHTNTVVVIPDITVLRVAVVAGFT
jgi:hypothetical protein